MSKLLDLIILLSFTTMFSLSMAMWISYDKLQHRLDEQRDVIAELIYENQSLTDDRDTAIQLHDELNAQLLRCKTFMGEIR